MKEIEDEDGNNEDGEEEEDGDSDIFPDVYAFSWIDAWFLKNNHAMFSTKTCIYNFKRRLRLMSNKVTNISLLRQFKQ